MATAVMVCDVKQTHIYLNLWGELMLFNLKGSLKSLVFLQSNPIVSEGFLNYKTTSLLECTEHEDIPCQAKAACIPALCAGRRNPSSPNCSSEKWGKTIRVPDGHSFSMRVVTMEGCTGQERLRYFPT